MLQVRLAAHAGRPAVLATPVRAAAPDESTPDIAEAAGSLAAAPETLPVAAETAEAFLADVEHSGAAGAAHALPRPGGEPKRVLFVGIGQGDASGWRAAGAAIA